MKFVEFKALVLQGVETIGEGFTEPDDDWMPVLLLDTRRGVIGPLMLPAQAFENDLRKEQFFAVTVPMMIRIAEARKVALVTSGWGVSLATENAEQRAQAEEYRRLYSEGIAPRASEHPDRAEYVILAVLDEEIAEIGTAKITRRDDAPPELGAWRFTNRDEGRVVELLQAALR